MNAERLLKHYERIADAPDAIARLRRFILDLAVRGKLVPQGPNDEPAHGFQKPNNPAASFNIPQSWWWARIGDQLELLNGMAFKPTDWIGSGLRIVRIQNLNNPLAPFNFCDPATARQRSLIDDGSFLISWSGTPGTSFGAFIWDRGPAVLNQHIFRCDFKTEAFTAPFLQLAINGRLDEMIAKAHGGVGLQHITKGKLEALLIPLPPLAEQRRIVAKVDELMVLCDQLEAARADREATRDRLTAASLARLNTPDPDQATFADHARFALDALPALTARPDQIKQYRQSILNLAVRGKLVSQDPRDEPANVKAAACDDRPEEIPMAWCYTRLCNLLAEDTRNGYSRKPDDAPEGTPILRISAGTVRRDGVVAEEEHKLISGIDQETRLQYGLKRGDLLACRFNGNKSFVGRLTIFKNYLGIQPIYPDKLIRVRIALNIAVPEFLQIAGDTDIVRSDIEASCATTVGNWGISASNLKEIRFPLPPLAEQHRIVAKVDALMALCDRLEASLASGDDTRRRLLDALLAEALAPAKTGAIESAA
jgi:type I restriction enzyme, S subunit